MNASPLLFSALGVALLGAGPCASPVPATEGSPKSGTTSVAASERTVTLLVHGITWGRESPIDIWGRFSETGDGNGWDGMIGYLGRQGMRFGGVVRASGGDFTINEVLIREGTQGPSDAADFFCLEFSKSASTDGISYKSLELSRCITELCRFTGCERVDIVAHSAGGVAAMAYIQDAYPALGFAHDVRRVITLGSPLLGSGLAEDLGDLLGTKATSLKPSADLLQRMSQLPLPEDVDFTSIVVRGIAADVRGDGDDYDALVNRNVLRGLPIDYRKGGDQVCHVKSQNLRILPCAEAFETQTGRAVHGILVRVPDPSPHDITPFQKTVHVSATRDRNVMDWVYRLLQDDGRFWTTGETELRHNLINEQLRQSAFSAIESRAMRRHRLHEVLSVEIETLREPEQPAADGIYEFTGTAHSRLRLVGRKRVPTEVRGKLKVDFDDHGRLVEVAAVP